jgi:hypothetical protein
MNAFKVISTAMLCIIGMVLLLFASVADAGEYQSRNGRMSAMGKRAAAAVARINAQSHATLTRARGTATTAKAALDDDDSCLNKPECGEEGEEEEEEIPGGRPNCRSRSTRPASTSSSVSMTRAAST